MNSNIVNLIEQILLPLTENKYMSNILLLLLLFNVQYILPYPLIPNNIQHILRNNKYISFILLLLLCYLFTRDINVSILFTILIYIIHFIVIKMENFDNHNDVILMINKYNYELDKVKNKLKETNNKLGYSKPQQIKNTINNNEKLPNVKENIKNNENNLKDDFEFSIDNLRYLRYDIDKLNKLEKI
jgi:hypothetical protein